VSTGLAGAGRPLPNPTALTEPFWAAAREHVLVRPSCRACGRSFFTPQAVCTNCLSSDWSYEPSTGRGVVHHSTVVHRPPFPEMAVPYHLAVVDLEEGWSMLANLDADASAPVAPGTAVDVAWLDLDGGYVLPVFTLRQEEAA
jgi:uncharacterized OB-fold protein